MSAEMATTTKSSANIMRPLINWLEPRSQDRDEAFRERTIRIATVLVLAVTFITLALSLFVTQQDWDWISFPTLTVVIAIGYISAAIAISRQLVRTSANLIVGTSVVAATGNLVLTTQVG